MPLLGLIDATLVALLLFVHADRATNKLAVAVGWTGIVAATVFGYA